MPTKISWCDESINPVIGCTKISPACQNCYAEKFALRLSEMGIKDYQQTLLYGKWSGNIVYRVREMDKVLKWKKPRRIFVVSMGDLFHENVTDEAIKYIVGCFYDTPQHTFMLLTKRPERAYHIFKHNPLPPNAWMGATVENQEQVNKRLPWLCKIDASVRFVSCEPLLEDINIAGYLPQIRWVISGCESGHGRRETDMDWFRKLMHQCRIAKVPFFLKQMEVNGKVEKEPKLYGKYHLEFPSGR